MSLRFVHLDIQRDVTEQLRRFLIDHQDGLAVVLITLIFGIRVIEQQRLAILVVGDAHGSLLGGFGFQ